jgi:hypothetical protein
MRQPNVQVREETFANDFVASVELQFRRCA